MYVPSKDVKPALQQKLLVQPKQDITQFERTNLWTVCLTSTGVVNYLNRKISPLGMPLPLFSHYIVLYCIVICHCDVFLQEICLFHDRLSHTVFSCKEGEFSQKKVPLRFASRPARFSQVAFAPHCVHAPGGIASLSHQHASCWTA